MTNSKEKILVVVSRFPFPLDKGDKLRAYYQIKELQHEFDVTVVALAHKEICQKKLQAIQEICSELVVCKVNILSKIWNMFLSILNGKPIQVGYFYNKRAHRKVNSLIKASNYKHLFAQLIRTAEYIKNVHHIPKMLDYMDTLSVGIERRIEQQSIIKRGFFKTEAKRLRKYEQGIFDYFEHKIIISEQDKNLIQHPEKSKIVCVPNGIDTTFFNAPPVEVEFDFVFVGNMSYPPNIEAAHYISEKILPYFKTSSILIAGASPSSSVQSLAKNNKYITITGWVDDIKISYMQGAIFIAPMQIGTGMQNKLLEAMALGIPCVTTPLANNAIGAKNQYEIMVGENEKELIECIGKLRNDQDFSNLIGENGAKFVQNNYQWKKTTAIMIDLINN